MAFKSFKEFVLTNKYLILIALFAVISILVSYFYIGYSPELQKDAAQYLEASQYLSRGGQISVDTLIHRVLTNPAFIYLSIFINKFLNDFSSSFAVVNIIFYPLLIIAFYFLALEIYKEKKIAFWGAMLVLFNYYVIDPNNSHLSDLGGWFFFVFGTYWAVRYFNTLNRKFYYFSLLTAIVGVFFQEYGGLGLINLALLIMVSDLPVKKKIKDVALVGAVFLIPLLSYHIFFYVKYHVTYFDRFLNVEVASSVAGFEPKNLSLLIKIMGWLFSFGWLAFCLGLKEEWLIADKRRLKILSAILPITLLFLIWPAITQRLAVVFMFWLALIAGFGLSRARWYLSYPFLMLYILFNYNIKFLIDKINLPF